MHLSAKPQSGRRSLARSICLSSASVIALVCLAQPVHGQAIYNTGFEPETYLADTPLAGQDDWTAPPPFSPAAAVVTDDRPRFGHQAVHVLGGDLVPQDFINEATAGYYDAIGSYRRAVNHDTGGSQTVCLSAFVRIDGPKTAKGDNFFSAGIAGRAESTFEGEPSSASVGELAISSDGRVYAYSGNENVPTFLGSKRVKLGEWHRLAIVADFSTQSSRLFVDGDLLATVAWDTTESYTGVLLRGALLAYAAPDTTANTKAAYAAHYDRFSIRVVPPRGCDNPDGGHQD